MPAMKHFLSRLLLCVLLAVAARAADAPGRPFLWRVSDTNGVVAHVFGSIHIPSPAATNLPASVEAALQKADAVYCELPFDDDTVRQAALAGMNAARPLSQVLSSNLYARTDAELRRILPVLSLTALDRAEVWTIAFQLMLLEDQLKHPSVPALDLLFYRRARAAGKEVGGLETLAEQVAAMNRFTVAEQVALLEATLADIEEARGRGTTPSAELLSLYLAGDEQALEREAERTLKTYPEELRRRFEQTLLAERNRVMAARIADKLRAAPRKQHLFVVGALHGFGQGSVLDLLTRAGFQVERASN